MMIVGNLLLNLMLCWLDIFGNIFVLFHAMSAKLILLAKCKFTNRSLCMKPINFSEKRFLVTVR